MPDHVAEPLHGLTYKSVEITFTGMLITDMTMKAFEAGLSRTRTVIVPFGSIEEHGMHLPLGTDTFHAYELARHAARLISVFVMPPVWYGLCRSTSRHPGTVGITSVSLRSLVMDMCRSMYRQGLRNFILISGHAGGTHMASILDSADNLLEELADARFAVLSILDLVAGLPEGLVETPGDAHAGEVETSLMRYLKPDLVKGTSPGEFPEFPRFILVRDKLKYWPGGVWGDPSRSSPEKGKSILDEEAELLSKLVKRLENFQEE